MIRRLSAQFEMASDSVDLCAVFVHRPIDITFRTPASERRRIVYSANAALRRKGLTPRPPGASAFRDLAEYYGFRARVGIKSLWR